MVQQSRAIISAKMELRHSNTQLADLTGANSIFGSMNNAGGFAVGTRAAFIPYDGNGNLVDLQNKITEIQPKWMKLNTPKMQYQAYVNCSPLGAVIDRLAEADTNGRFSILKPDGTLVTDARSGIVSRVQSLFDKPNPFQTWEEFNAQQVIICKIHGYCPVFFVGAPGIYDKSYSKYMFNIDPEFASPEMIDAESFDIYDLPEDFDPIVKWKFTLFGKEFNIPTEDILVIQDGFLPKKNNFGLSLSKIEGLEFAISNIIAAMEADNVLLKKKGPLGIFSHDPKSDIAGWQPMGNDEKKELQEDLRQYGLTLGQLQYIISKQPIKWNPMSFNLRDLMTKETARQGIDMICDRFGHPAELMSGKNATYENRDSAEKYMYESNIIPFSLRRMAAYTEYLGLKKLKYKAVLDYKHLTVLQEDLVKESQARKFRSDSLVQDWEANVITYDEYRVAQGYDKDTRGDGELRKFEFDKKYKIANDANNSSTTGKNTAAKKEGVTNK